MPAYYIYILIFKSYMSPSCVTVTPLKISSRRNTHPIPFPFHVKLKLF